jgi:hypothetical protein
LLRDRSFVVANCSPWSSARRRHRRPTALADKKVRDMAKGQEKKAKNNKPKLSIEDKKKKKKEKAAAKA